MIRIRATRLAVCLALVALLVAASIGRADEKLDVTYVSVDAIAAIVLHPAQTLASPELEMLPVEVAVAACVEHLGFDPRDVELAIGMVSLSGLPAGEPGMGAVLKFSKPYDKDMLNERLGAHTREATRNGKTYRESTEKGGFGYCMADDRTLLVATNLQIKAMLAPEKRETPLVKLLKQLDTSRTAVAVLDFASVRPMLQLALQSAPPVPDEFKEFLEIPELVSWIEVSLNLKDGFDFEVTLGGNDAAAAERLKELGERAKKLGRQYIETQIAEALPQSQSETDKALAKYIQRILGRLFDAIQIKVENERVNVRLVGLNSNFATMGILVALTLPAVQAAREAARRAAATNELREIGLGMHSYANVKREFPARAILDAEGKPLLSWRVAILPYIGEEALYKQFHLDEPWDSPHNRKLVKIMPAAYRNPSLEGEGNTTFLAIVAPGTIFESPRGLRFRDIRDGLSKTIFVVEADADRAVPWTQPEDLKVDLRKPRAGLGNMRAGGFLTLFADGSVHFVNNNVDPDLLRALYTYAGGETVNIPEP